MRAVAATGLLLAWSVSAVAAQVERSQEQQPPEPCVVQGVTGNALCGSYTVYENREARAGRRIGIGIVVLRALDEPSEPSPVVFVAGGPGQSAIDIAPSMGRAFAGVRRRRDLVFIDQRGTGRSNPLHCNAPLANGPASLFGSVFPEDHIQSCRDSLSQRADLALYTTAIATDDMDEIREWLGYEQVNLYGGSYGTRVVQVYMRRHPTRVRTAIMNGVDPVNRITYLHGAVNLQIALERLMLECEGDTDCAEVFPDFRSQMSGLIAGFGNGPVRTRYANRWVDFSQGDFAYAVRGMLYGSLASRLPLMVREAYRTKDLSAFADYYVERSSWVASDDIGTGMHLTIMCAEDIAFADDHEIRMLSGDTFMRDHLIQQYRNACRRWVQADLPERYRELVTSSVPTLLLSGGRDPVTPARWGAEVAERLSNSLHVVVPNAGHGVGGSCVAEMQRRLIEDGSLTNVDTSCVVSSPPTRFLLRRF